MKTEILVAGGSASSAVNRAVELLQQGEIVAVPTETVYGLAADALNPDAAIKIFEAKERPRFDPLIVHLPHLDWLQRLANVPTYIRKLTDALTQTFWPGPLTIVLPKSDLVPDVVTAGLDTVATRISAHPVFGDVVRAFGRPIAAPSANRFGRISPTDAAHVFDELDGRVELIIDGGATHHGIESTVIGLNRGAIQILRPGPVTAAQLAPFAKVEMVAPSKTISAPGQLPIHYAPRTPLRLIEDTDSFHPAPGQRVGLLRWSSAKQDLAGGYCMIRYLSRRDDLREAALNLFRYLRELDAAELDLIVAERVPEEGVGVAINDRLRRGAGRAGC